MTLIYNYENDYNSKWDKEIGERMHNEVLLHASHRWTLLKVRPGFQVSSASGRLKRSGWQFCRLLGSPIPFDQSYLGLLTANMILFGLLTANPIQFCLLTTKPILFGLMMPTRSYSVWRRQPNLIRFDDLGGLIPGCQSSNHYYYE